MKKYIKWITFVICGVSIAIGLQLGEKTNLVDISMQNIEALANSESGSISCYFPGSLDCPISGSKVSYIIK